MQKKFYIPNLITKSIPKGVVDHILDQTIKHIHENLYVNISSTGNDDTADGSQEKPFKTLNKALEFVRRTVHIYKIGAGVRINFLTDYTETENIVYFKRIVGEDFSETMYTTVYTNGHNVQLNAIKVEGTSVIFADEITFNCNVPTLTAPLVYSLKEGSIAFKKNITINLNSKKVTTNLIAVLKYSAIDCYGDIIINVKQPCECKAIIGEDQYAFFNIRKNISTYGEAVTLTDCFLRMNVYSYMNIYRDSTITAQNQFTGKRYVVSLACTITTHGKGAEFLPGSTNGTLEYNGEYY